VTKLDLSRARAHDLGGQKGGPVERGAHETEPWHNLVTAILAVLRDEPHRLVKIDEMRRAIEDMPPDDYRRLEYFEKWAVGVSTLMVEKGLMTRDEIDRRVTLLKARGGPR
jgi:hypothetical protein